MEGLWIGIVTDNQDEKGTYRVKVKLPALDNSMKDDHDHYVTDWCRIATLMGGDHQGGFFYKPQLGDEVVVAFFHGQISHPVILGALWSDVAAGAEQNTNQEHPQHRPIYDDYHACGSESCGATKTCGPVTEKNLQGMHEAKKNDLRVFRSRAGHQLIFNDNEKESRVVVHTAKGHKLVMVDPKQGDGGGDQYLLLADHADDPDGKGEHAGQSILMDTKNGVMTLTAQKQIILKTKELIKLDCEDKIQTISKGNTDMTVKKSLTVTVSETTVIDTKKQMDLKGQPLHLNVN
jgi:uncharacterized protein involved in type VI secretion and phage assembly